MVQHHLVIFASDARLLVAAEGGVGGVGVVAIGPDSPGLDRPAKTVTGVGVAAPYARAQAVFIGGSLAPLGGQNFLEALAQGVAPVPSS